MNILQLIPSNNLNSNKQKCIKLHLINNSYKQLHCVKEKSSSNFSDHFNDRRRRRKRRRSLVRYSTVRFFFAYLSQLGRLCIFQVVWDQTVVLEPLEPRPDLLVSNRPQKSPCQKWDSNSVGNIIIEQSLEYEINKAYFLFSKSYEVCFKTSALCGEEHFRRRAVRAVTDFCPLFIHAFLPSNHSGGEQAVWRLRGREKLSRHALPRSHPFALPQ